MENLEQLEDQLKQTEREATELLSQIGQLTPLFDRLRETNDGLSTTSSKLGEVATGITGATESLRRLTSGLEAMVSVLKQGDIQSMNQKIDNIRQSCEQLADKVSTVESQIDESTNASKNLYNDLSGEIRKRFVWLLIILAGVTGAAGMQLVLSVQ